MDQRRFIVFFTLSMAIWIGWIHFLVPMLFPVPPRIPKPPGVPYVFDEPADALTPANVFNRDGEMVKPVVELPKNPDKSVWIGPTADETDPKKLAEFFLAANFDSRGAMINSIQLTDVARYPAFNKRGTRLDLVSGWGAATGRSTFDLRIPVIDKLLEQPLDRISWEISAETDDSVTFRMRSPDGVWEILKQFKLRKLSAEELKKPHVRDNFADGYEIKLTVTLKNLSGRSEKIQYILQGPTGVPLEDKENTYKYRDVRMGFLREDGVTVDDSKMSASEVVKKEKANTSIRWTRPIKYIGIDVAYFAAMILPAGDQVRNPTIEHATAVIASEDKTNSQYSDISVELKSNELSVPAHDEVRHEYTLYTGPKQKQLLQQIAAGAVMDYGWFDSICRGMVWILNAFHAAGLSYGLAIICLTVVVRSLLIPLSRHQAAHAARMKELQPKIQARQKELEARHGKNTEEYIKASQEMVAEQSKMMLGGCLPMFLQLPIFIALYRSLGSSIELRMEPFLWFENLASPDAMFRFPWGKLPLLGWTEFNLLPCISIGLMIAHQKLTMPPPQNEEQAAQYKMMNIMMFVMGATFYRVPAGLCLYFIMTNVWSMTERWIFEKQAQRAKLNPPPDAPPSGPNGPGGGPVEPPKPPWYSKYVKQWQRLLEAADKNTSIRRGDTNAADGKNGVDWKSGKKRGKR